MRRSFSLRNFASSFLCEIFWLDAVIHARPPRKTANQETTKGQTSLWYCRAGCYTASAYLVGQLA